MSKLNKLIQEYGIKPSNSCSSLSSYRPITAPVGTDYSHLFSFEEIVGGGCPALTDLWEGQSFDHSQRVMLLSLAINTFDGVKALSSRWPSKRTEYHVNHAIGSSYKPWTCRRIQQDGVCLESIHPIFDDCCFVKKGESEPSPIRSGRVQGRDHEC